MTAALISSVLLAGFCLGGDEASIKGVVRDAGGKPVAGAVVRLTSTEGLFGQEPAATREDGAYVLTVRSKPGAAVKISGISVAARGYVRFDEELLFRPLSLSAGESESLDFVLAKGEPLAGRVEVPLFRGERSAGIDPGERQFAFTARGPSFKQVFLTEKGGDFEVWVPKGTYSLELFGEPGWPPVRLEDVPSGSRGLKLALEDPYLSEAALSRAFDTLWRDMDSQYSYFELKKIDWRGLRERFRDRAVKAGSARKLVDVLEEMLAELRDGHVWIEWEGQVIVPYAPTPRPENYNRQVTLAALTDIVPCGQFAVVGRTKADGLAAFVLVRQSKADEASVKAAVEAIQGMMDAPGFLIDLRSANGGNELLAQEIARQFCGEDAVYAKSKYRDGPEHGDFGPTYERVLKATEKPYSGPVVCLIGPYCVSSGEAFAKMMKCLPNVTMAGSRTRGSSGNPKPLTLGGPEVTVYYSRWVDMLPDGSPLEGAGVAPDVELEFPAKAYEEGDPTWDKGLEILRKKAAR